MPAVFRTDFAHALVPVKTIVVSSFDFLYIHVRAQLNIFKNQHAKRPKSHFKILNVLLHPNITGTFVGVLRITAPLRGTRQPALLIDRDCQHQIYLELLSPIQ